MITVALAATYGYQISSITFDPPRHNVPLADEEADLAAKSFHPRQHKSNIYVSRCSMGPINDRVTVVLDDDWLNRELAAQTYYLNEADLGEHSVAVMTTSEDAGPIEFEAETGFEFDSDMFSDEPFETLENWGHVSDAARKLGHRIRAIVSFIIRRADWRFDSQASHRSRSSDPRPASGNRPATQSD